MEKQFIFSDFCTAWRQNLETTARRFEYEMKTFKVSVYSRKQNYYVKATFFFWIWLFQSQTQEWQHSLQKKKVSRPLSVF